jgi:hypothetical protein
MLKISPFLQRKYIVCRRIAALVVTCRTKPSLIARPSLHALQVEAAHRECEGLAACVSAHDSAQAQLLSRIDEALAQSAVLQDEYVQ